MKIAKARTIYDNYDLSETYSDEDIKDLIKANGYEEEDITESMMWDWRYEESQIDWECQKDELTSFFKGKIVGFFGQIGRWNGVYMAGQIGEFWELFDKAITDCDYIRLYDENGHFYLTCSHHDGSNHFEVKEITDSGRDYLDRWEWNWDDGRSEQYIHNQIFKRYSRLPHYAHKQWGCKTREYEPSNKASLIRQLNNQARSFYS